MPDNQVPEVEPQEAQNRIRAGAMLLDVRRQDEFDEARIPGSTLIVLDELQTRLAELPRDRQIIVHCKSGGRSARAAAWLNSNGLDAVNMQGGIDEWKQLGLEVEPGA